MEETAFQYPSRQNKGKNIKLAIIMGVVVLMAGFIGILLTRQPKKENVKTDITIEKKEPSPTTKPKIEKSSVKIQVVNGTGTPGQAGVVVKALEDAGYNSDNIKTSNAEKFDNATTTINARADFEEIVKDVKDVLTPTFEEITIDSSILDIESEFDIIVVTGGEIFEAATPTPSVTGSTTLTPSSTITPTLTLSPTPSLTPIP